MTKVRLLLSFVCFILLSVSAHTELQLQDPVFPVPARSLGAADYNWPLKDLNGNKIDLNNYRGKVLFINVWATWCPPCVAEMPAIQALFGKMSEEIKRGEVVFLAISDENAPVVSTFVEGGRYTFPVAITNRSDIPRIFRSQGIPTTYIVDSQGYVVYKHLGAANWASESTVQFLRGQR